MIATLNSYDSMFGPYHPQTLALTVQIARALRSTGDMPAARALLEHAVKHLASDGDQVNSLRTAALTELRHVLVDLNDTEKAIAVQKEIVRSKALTAGTDDSNVAEARADLVRMLLSSQPGGAAA
jgi:hypothetical protein